MTMRVITSICTLMMILSAGCVEGSESIYIKNEANEPFRLQLLILDEPGGTEVHEASYDVETNGTATDQLALQRGKYRAIASGHGMEREHVFTISSWGDTRLEVFVSHDEIRMGTSVAD